MKATQHTMYEKDNRELLMNNKGIIYICLLIVLIISSFYPIIKYLVYFWLESDDFSHGFLILPIALYIVWLKKEDLDEIDNRYQRLGLCIVTISLLIYLVSHFAGVKTIEALCLPAFVSGAVIYLFGHKFFFKLLFPIAYLIFMIPIPAQIYTALTLPLQLLVSKISVDLSQLVYLPIYREGNVIHLPDATLQVVTACSGLRSLVSLLALTVVFGYFSFQSCVKRGLLLLTCIPVAIIVNVVRVVTIITGIFYFKKNLSYGTGHIVLGMVVFVLALLMVYATQKLLKIGK
jgi:exosortase A